MSKKQTKYNISRTPVVAVMGHVDHGKTSLLDAIRDTSVQDSEVGGITQNTRAHEVEHEGNKLTFIDTPGHEAFSGMRSRGADVTDLVLLVVAADDGVKPQTKESIKFAKESGKTILVAINKIDVPGKDVARIKNELAQNDVLVEEYGGDVQVFEISATQKTGLEELLEGILLQVEMLELTETETKLGTADAVVLESTLHNKLGAISLVLIKSGKVSVGDIVVTNTNTSTIRALLDEHHNVVEEGAESMPVWVVGLQDVVSTGDILTFEKDEKKAKKILKDIKEGEVVVGIEEPEVEEGEIDELGLLASLLAAEQKDEDIKKLNVVIRADTQGTLEVVLNEVKKLNNDEVMVNVLSSGTGNITRKDVLTAKNAGGIVLGFQVIVPTKLTRIVKEEKVLVRVYSVIYELIEELGEAMKGMLEPDEVEEEVARASVKKVFTLTDGSTVSGCVVKSGNILRGYRVWVERGEYEIGRGKITSLKQLKREVKEVQKGSECGIIIDPNVEVEEGDQIVLYKLVTN